MSEENTESLLQPWYHYEVTKDVMRHHGMILPTKPCLPSEAEFNFRSKFLDEELNELFTAYEKENIVEMADAIADLIIVAMGLAANMGLPLGEIMQLVNFANKYGKRMVMSTEESKRGYEFDLKKTGEFISPERGIAILLFGEEHE